MSEDLSHIRFISAGAGSGKTYFLTEQLEEALVARRIDPARILATTFTVKAAGELEQRVRQRLITGGRQDLAAQVDQALIGTVHSVCERLLQRFAFELGLSPRLQVASIEDTADLFRGALDGVLDNQRVRAMNALAYRLNIDDWQQAVQAIADSARSNDLDDERLRRDGRDSAESLLAGFAAPAATDLDTTLREAIDRALATIDQEYDQTQATADYVTGLRDAQRAIARGDCFWADWIRLRGKRAGAKSDAIAASVREAARFEAHPRLHADIRAYTEGVFAIAADALERFTAGKRRLGLIDFTDMEQLTLEALDDAVVRARLTDELELLLVDEFQDTNPMQLAIFVKLARLADDVVYVGDVKQAIYAFRGCDTELVFDTLAGIAAAGASTEVLPRSYRSRPPLVEYVNHVFTHVFEGKIPADKVVLEAAREESTGAPAVCHWQLQGRNKELRWSALARGVADLIASEYPVVDPDTEVARPVSWSDVAVLAPTNEHVEGIALALRAARVPMRMTLSGLLAVPEVCLARACLRRLDDRGDTLATAEIIALSNGQEPEAWLEDRLRWLAGGEPSRGWGESTAPIVMCLAAMREQIQHLSPVEVVARVLNTTGIREAVTAWGPDETKAAQRHRNLDAFLNLAVEYENHAAMAHEAATLTGFLFWLENPRSPELDLQPTVTVGDAVHVLTHHRAKGMEWPVVVATGLDYTWRSRLWDVRAESGEALDVRDPLASRHIRYWPGIFGKSKPQLRQALEASDYGRRCAAESHAESQRLAYVAMTRARDLLVLPLPAGRLKETAWLRAIETPYLLPDGDALVLPGGTEIPSLHLSLEPLTEAREPRPYAPRWFVAREPLPAPLAETSSPSQAPALVQAEVLEQVALGERLDLNGASDMAAVGSALHAIIAAELINPGEDDAVARARAILARAGLEHYLDAGATVAAARRFTAFLQTRWVTGRVFAEYPVRHRLANGQVVRGWIDALVETEAGWLVVDHKSSPRPRSAWVEEAREYSGQLKAYCDALSVGGLTVAGAWVHFPVSGGIVELAGTHARGGAR